MSTSSKNLAQAATQPSYNAPEQIYFGGQFVPADDAKISVKTHGFLYGTSIFEGIRGYHVPERNVISIFRMREHYERMLNNARVFYMTPGDPSLTLEKMMAVTTELVARNKPTTDVYIRPTLYKSEALINPQLLNHPAEFTVWTQPMGQYLDLTKGLNVCVSNWRRLSDNALPPRGKASGAYMSTALAISDARQGGFDDAIFLTEEGMVSEGSAMNLFLVLNGKLVTPSTQQKILPGITRHTIMTLAREHFNLEIEERPVERSELYYAQEAFFAGTGAQVAPIARIDHRPVGTGEMGPITRQLQNLYFEVVKAQHEQYSAWCTVVELA